MPLAAAEEAAEKDMTPWLWANFIILVIALGYLTKKYGGPFLAARSANIQQGIAAANARKAEADRRVADVEARLANLGGEIEKLKTEIRAEQGREADRIAARNAVDIARIHQQAEQEIDALTKAARLELQEHAGNLALQLAEQKIRARMNPETQRKLNRDFLNSIS